MHNDTKVRGTRPNLNPQIYLRSPTEHFENTDVGQAYDLPAPPLNTDR